MIRLHVLLFCSLCAGLLFWFPRDMQAADQPTVEVKLLDRKSVV